MAKKQRPSVQKRERERKKAEKAALKRERRLNRDRQDSSPPPEGAVDASDSGGGETESSG
jgi:hypothetical protein